MLHGEFNWPHPQEHPGVRPEGLDWDGRIDNQTDLRAQLTDILRGDSRTFALAVGAYERWGVPGLGRVVGDWSLVLHDSAKHLIVLASDYAGIRPLYYQHEAGRLRWSSRIDVLASMGNCDEIDETYAAGFLLFGGCPNRTPYEGILSVPPGHAVCFTPTQATILPFWTLPTSDVIRYRDERQYEEQFRALFREAVHVRLQSPLPAVAELSGGLDSSSVVCMANELVRSGAVATPKLTSISYVHRDSLDTPFIREVEAHCGLDGVHLSTHDTPLASLADGRNSLPGESAPLEDAAAMTTRRLGAKVYLTGQNGDLVAGNWFDDSLQVAAPLRHLHFGDAFTEALAWSKVLRIPVLWVLARAARALMPPLHGGAGLYSIEGKPRAEDSDSSLLPAFLDRAGVAGPASLFSNQWMQAAPERRKHFYALTIMRELRTLQVRGTMEGIDWTHPFAHRPLVEFLMSVPANVLCRPGEPRRLMRRALADLWPSRLRARRSKNLLATPQFEALRPLAVRLLAERQWQVVDRGWVSAASLASRLEKLKNGVDRNAPQLRQLILLEFWLRARHENHTVEDTRLAG